MEKLLDTNVSLELAREAYTKQARHMVINPSRIFLQVPEGASVYCMTAHVLGSLSVAVKIARVGPRNASMMIPTTLATLYVYNSQTGELIAEIEAETLTAMRTAASTAVATEKLARTSSSVLGLFGTGKQAQAHVPAILNVRPIETILTYAR
ncbi:MAG TPA: hypothetical protein VE177_00185, partial [Candidatus Binatus sp.]|nr:hypothetical protein [Candidatus Binatus sp.]